MVGVTVKVAQQEIEAVAPVVLVARVQHINSAMSFDAGPTPVNLLASYLCYRKIEVQLSPLHVDGVVATEFICSDDIIFAERPLCFQQTLPNSQDVIICGECQTVLEPLDIQVGILSKSITRECVTTRADICQCRTKCGVLYCSGEIPSS